MKKFIAGIATGIFLLCTVIIIANYALNSNIFPMRYNASPNTVTTNSTNGVRWVCPNCEEVNAPRDTKCKSCGEDRTIHKDNDDNSVDGRAFIRRCLEEGEPSTNKDSLPEQEQNTNPQIKNNISPRNTRLCSIPDCQYTAQINSYYCFIHECRETGCHERCTNDHCNYCIDHKCLMPDCNSGHMFNSYYCPIHNKKTYKINKYVK